MTKKDIDAFGDPVGDELDLGDDALTIGADPEDDFEDAGGAPAEQPESTGEAVEAPEADTETLPAEHLARQAEAQQSVEAWAAEVERRRGLYAAAREAVIAAEKAYDEGAGSSEDKIAAIERLADAKYDVRQAEETHNKAVEYSAATANANPAQEAWAARNPRLSTDPRFLADAKAAYAEIKQSGMDERHPNFYAELDRRLKRTPPMNRNGRTSGAPVSSGARNAGGAGQALTEQDKQQLREWGLVKPGMSKEKRIAVAKEYLRQKTIAQTERRAG